MNATRVLHILGSLAAAWALLFVRFSAGVFPPTEVDPFVHYALLPIALLLAVANGAAEANGLGSALRRDSLWGLSAALASFAVLHWAKVV